MKFDSLSSVRLLPASAVTAARCDDFRRRVHAMTASSADRDLPFRPPPPIADDREGSAEWAARAVRDVVTCMLQLGGRARRLLRPAHGKTTSVDEEV